MNIFNSGNDAVKRLEAQLKQRNVQMDNLDNAIIKLRKELAQCKDTCDQARQDAHFHERRADENDTAKLKLERELKQRSEALNCMTSQLLAKDAEIAQKEKVIREANQELLQSSREAAEATSRSKILGSELQAARASLQDMGERLRNAKAANTRDMAELTAKLASAADAVECKDAKLVKYAARLESEHVDTDNRLASMKSLQSQLKAQDHQYHNESSQAASAVQELENRLRTVQAAAVQTSARTAQLEQALNLERNCHQATKLELVEVQAQLKAAAQSDNSDVACWQSKYESLIEERDRVLERSNESSAAMQHLANAHEKLEQKVLKLASERDVLQLKLQEVTEVGVNDDFGKRKKRAVTNGIEEERGALPEKVAALQASLAAADADLTCEKESRQKSEAELASATRTLQDLRTSVFEQGKELASTKMKLTKANDLVAGLNARVAELQRDCLSQQAQIAADKGARERAELESLRYQQELHLVRQQAAAQVQEEGVGRSSPARDHVPLKSTPSGGMVRELADLKEQLRDEVGKRQLIQQQLLAEQHHFANQLQQIKEMTKGEAKDTPGSAVHGIVTHMQRQLDAVRGGADITAVQSRSMCTPLTQAASPGVDLTAMRSTSLPTAVSKPTTGRPGTSTTSRTPLSAKGNTMEDDNASYWHKKYEEQAVKLAALESSHRRLSLQNGQVAAGGTPRSARRRSFGFASPRLASLTPTLVREAAGSTPSTQALCSADEECRRGVGREVDMAPFGGPKGQENTPTLGTSGGCR